MEKARKSNKFKWKYCHRGTYRSNVKRDGRNQVWFYIYLLVFYTWKYTYFCLATLFCVNILFCCPRYHGKAFRYGLIQLVKFRKRRSKSSPKIRYFHYYLWTCCLYLKEIGNKKQTFSYPASVLQYIRYLAPGDTFGR